MTLSRRQLLGAASAIALLAATPTLAYKNGLPGQKVTNNVNLPYGLEQQFINQVGLGNNTWAATAPFTEDVWALMNADGYPMRMPIGGGGIRLTEPSYVNKTSTLVVDWVGDATFGNPSFFSGGATVTLSAPTVISANRKEYTISATALNDGDPWVWQISLSTIPTSLSNLRVYWKKSLNGVDQEALLAAGKICNPDWVAANNFWGRLRLMNWNCANTSASVHWDQRTSVNNISKIGTGVNPIYYGGQCSKSGNTFTSGALGTQPSAWTHGQWVQCIPTFFNITNIDNNATAPTVTTSAEHNYAVNDTVVFANLQGSFTGGVKLANGTRFQITAVTSTTFTVSTYTGGTVDLSAAGAFSTVTGPLALNTLSIQNITAFTANATPQVTTATPHGLTTGDQVFFYNTFGSAGTFASNTTGNSYTITKVDATNFTLNSTNSSTWTGFSSGGMNVSRVLKVDAPKLGGGTLGAKLVINPSLGLSNGAGIASLAASTMLTWDYTNPFAFIYDSDLDALIPTSIGQNQQGPGLAPETVAAIHNEINTGNSRPVEIWTCLPPGADTTYWTNYATTLRDGITAPGKVIYEFGNELWNNSGGIWTGWLTAKGFALQGLTSTGSCYQTYGYFFGVNMAAVEAVYGATRSTRVTRMFAFAMGDQAIAPAVNSLLTNRMTAPGYSPATAPISHADEMCPASYIQPNKSTICSTQYIWQAVYGTSDLQNAAYDYFATAWMTDNAGSSLSARYYNGTANNGAWSDCVYVANHQAGGIPVGAYEGGNNLQTTAGTALTFVGPNPYTPPSTGVPVLLTAPPTSNNDQDRAFQNFNGSAQYGSVLLSVFRGLQLAGGHAPAQYCTYGSLSSLWYLRSPNLYGASTPPFAAVRAYNG